MQFSSDATIYSRTKFFLSELFVFGWHNAWSCLFPVSIFTILAVSRLVSIPGLPRYDFILIACLLVQLLMYITRLETRDELLVITLFHLLGLAMEIFKIRMGSWSYPEFAYTKLAGVPVYSGFMYASVASYICQAWRRFGLKFYSWPPRWMVWMTGAAIYFNFFTHHFIFDFRWVLAATVLVLFFRTKVGFVNNGPERKMPMTLAFLLIGFFIWLAENIATFLGAWKYAYQHENWKMVGTGKLSAWALLVIVSIIIVAELKFYKERQEQLNIPAGPNPDNPN